MLIDDFISQEDRKRFNELADGPEKRAVARRYENEVLKRLGYLYGEPQGPTPGWRLFPDEPAQPAAPKSIKHGFGAR